MSEPKPIIIKATFTEARELLATKYQDCRKLALFSSAIVEVDQLSSEIKSTLCEYELVIYLGDSSALSQVNPLSLFGELNLTALMVRGIPEIGQNITWARFADLSSLHLVDCKLSRQNIQEVSTLDQLRSLDLSFNKIGPRSAIAIANLKNLTSLDLSRNRIGPRGAKAITNLNNLTSLNLDKNNIGPGGAKAIANLNNLTSLNLNYNKIGPDGAKAIANLANLTELDISDNKITDDALPQLSRLKKITTLELNHNPITDITPLEPLLVRGLGITADRWALKGINLFECPVTVPPPEIIEQGRSAVLNYFNERRAQGTEPLFEAKMLIVGEGGVGKTSLRQQLYHPEKGLTKEEETTKGIDIEFIRFPITDERNFRLNVWDFGGQHIYHATHQFFLTKRSLYILVDSSRTNDKTVQDEAFKYWLEVIETLSAGSPVLLFQNQVGGRSKAIDEKGIKSRFSNVKEFYAGNLANAECVAPIKQGIEYHAKQLEHIGEEVPKKWVSIRKELEESAQQNPFISQREYFDIYAKHLDFDKEKALYLSQFFHDLGVFLHFKDDPQLAKLVILQNDWATEAVFKVLDDEQVKANIGRFTWVDCRRIWCDHLYEDMHTELLVLMAKFELCYQLPDSNPTTFLATQLLPASMPDELSDWSNTNGVCLHYRYEFLPKGLINRLMVRMNRYVQQPDLAWSYGVLFEKGKTQLLIQVASNGDEIILQSIGPEARELLSVIAHDLDAINQSFEGLHNKVEKLVPCICAECKNSSNPHLYTEHLLVRKRDANSFQIECQKSFINVNVLELLNGLKLDLPNWPEQKKRHNVITQENKAITTEATSGAPVTTTIKIFLASSEELKAERDAFDLHFRRENDHLRKQGIYLEIIRWECFLDAMSETRSQVEYNQAVKDCDIFVSLFKTKTGKFTEEEFDTAHQQFKARGKPKIYTYFQDTNVSTSSKYKSDLLSLWAFQEKLNELGHYHTSFTSSDNLHVKFKEQLRKLTEEYNEKSNQPKYK